MDELASLIAMIPPQYLFYVLLALKSWVAINFTSSHLSAALKLTLGKPRTPETHPRAALFGFVRLLDWAALNTSKPVDTKLIADLEKQVAENERKQFALREQIGKKNATIDQHEDTIARQAVTIKTTIGLKGKP